MTAFTIIVMIVGIACALFSAGVAALMEDARIREDTEAERKNAIRLGLFLLLTIAAITTLGLT